MKTTICTLLVLLTAALAQAGQTESGAEAKPPSAEALCTQIAAKGYNDEAIACMSRYSQREVNPELVGSCQRILNRGAMSQSLGCLEQATKIFGEINSQALGICNRIIDKGYYDRGIDCMRTLPLIGAKLDSNAVAICETLAAAAYVDLAITCVQTIKGEFYESRATKSCQIMANRGYRDDAVSCLSMIKNKRIFVGLPICEEMLSRGNVAKATECLKTAIQLGDRQAPSASTNVPVESGTCYVRQLNQWLDHETFYASVSQWAREKRSCAAAKIAFTDHSGRVYRANGSRVEKERGGLSNNEVKDLLEEQGLYNCEHFVCGENK